MLKIKERELQEHLEDEDFFRQYGNPVKVESNGKEYVLLSIELAEKLLGPIDFEVETVVGMREFLKTDNDQT